MTHESVINELIKGLYERPARVEEIGYYKSLFDRGLSLAEIIRVLKNNPFFYSKFLDLNHHIERTDSVLFMLENKPQYVFIHIPRTAGQKLHFLLKKACVDLSISPMFQKIELKPLKFIYTYDILYGHLDYETAKTFVQKKDVKYIIFLRDPVKRLVSLYKFWWMHIPDEHPRNYAVVLANCLSIEDFFEDSYVKENLWNDMFGRYVGYRTLRKVREEYSSLNKRNRKEYINEVIIPILENQCHNYFFIGIQESFSVCVRELFKRMGVKIEDRDLMSSKINSSNELLNKNGYKSTVLDLNLNKELQKKLKKLTELDSVLYKWVCRKKQIKGEKDERSFCKTVSKK